MKNRWTVTLPNGSVKRFQSRIGAESHADQYDGTVTEPDRDPEEVGYEPDPLASFESSREQELREAREAAEREADGTGGGSAESGSDETPPSGGIDLNV